MGFGWPNAETSDLSAILLVAILCALLAVLLLLSALSLIELLRGWYSLTVEREEILECGPELVEEEV